MPTLAEPERKRRPAAAYVKLPAGLIEDVRDGALPPRALSCYSALRYHADGAGLAWPSQDSIAAFMQCQPRTVRTALGELIAAGWITSTGQQHYRGRLTTNAYTIHDRRQLIADGQAATHCQDSRQLIATKQEPLNKNHREQAQLDLSGSSPAMDEPTTAPHGANSDPFDSEEPCPGLTADGCPHRAQRTRAPRGETNPYCRECGRDLSAVELMAHRDRIAHEADPQTGAARRAIAARFSDDPEAQS